MNTQDQTPETPHQGALQPFTLNACPWWLAGFIMMAAATHYSAQITLVSLRQTKDEAKPKP